MRRFRLRHFFLLLLALGAGLWLLMGSAAFLNTFRGLNPEDLRPICKGLPAGATMSGAPSGGGATPQGRFAALLGDPKTSGLRNWPGPFDVTPKAFDIDRDGVDEIIAQSNDTNVYVFSATTGRALAVLPTSYPPGWYIERVLNGVEAAVLEPGRPVSLVVTDHAACVAVWDFIPGQSGADRFVFTKRWEHRMADCFWNPGMDAKPALADVDGDGSVEIFVQTEELGFFALRADGTQLWKHCWAGGNSPIVIADLERDGKPEAVVASDSGFVAVLRAATGEPLWTFNAADPSYGVRPASIPVAPTVADLDGQLPLEILFTTRNAPFSDPSRFHENHLAIFAIHQNRTTWQTEVLWVRQPTWAHPLSYTQLAVHDADGDGRADIFGMDWNTIGHFPGNWERLGPAHVFRLTDQGEDVWVRELDTWWSNKDIVLADVDADGQLDVLANGPNGDAGDGFWRLSAADGEPLQFLGAPAWQIMRGPLLLDLRHDGTTQLVYAVRPTDSKLEQGAIVVTDLNVPYNAPWRGTT